eukprot:6184474-Pleurochrysis_carterae.AAC.2
MGQLGITKVSPVYPNGLSRDIVPLRSSRVILTVPQWHRDGSPDIWHDMIGSVRWHCLCCRRLCGFTGYESAG